MTINVAVKCPDGIIMGADGLVTIPGLEEGSVGSMVPYFTKLFEIKGFSAAAMINGTGSIGGRTIEDIVAEFGETPEGQDSQNYSLKELAEKLGEKIQSVVNAYGRPITLEVIVGGYSKGQKAEGKRYGEIHNLMWRKRMDEGSKPNRFYSKPIYPADRSFGTHYGGQTKVLERFKYGIDEYILDEMWLRRDRLFNQVLRYILERLRKEEVNIPQNIQIDVPQRLGDFDVYGLFSDYERSGTGEEKIKKVKEGMKGRLKTMEGYFSLQTAVNYCLFLMWCAYAENAFTLIVPGVGSEMRIASITRKGFELIKKWEIQSPGPPFK